VEDHVKAISKGLKEAGDDVTIYASDLYDEGQWDRRTEWAPEVNGIPVVRLPVARRLFPHLTLPLMVGLVRKLTQDRPEVIQAHSHRYGHVLESAAVSRKTGIPLVVTTHYHPADVVEPWSNKLLLRLQDHLFGLTAYRTASALVYQSDLERAQLAEFAPKDRLWYIPDGIWLEDWSHPEQDRPPDGLPDGYILFAGRLARNKGLPVLLEAYAGIPKDQRLPLVLVGKDWGLKSSLMAQAEKLGIADDLRWIGYVESAAAYRAVFRRASVFVLPSEYEAFGIVLLEAMAADVPIVSSAVGGMVELLQGGACGKLVPYGDREGLRAAILDAASRSERTLGALEAARLRVRAFDWSQAVRMHRGLFAAVTGRARAR
jgi:glycosyltransferase involved in cell wall biosynthesis